MELKKHTALVTLFASLALVGLYMNDHDARAQVGPPAVVPSPASPVQVVGPLPLPVTGSSTVSGTVSVTNPVDTPLLVRDVDRLVRTPFQQGLSTTGGGGFCQTSTDLCQVSLTVGNNKLLVIEHLSVSAQVPAGQRLVVSFFTGATMEVPMQFLGTFTSGIAIGTGDLFGANLPVRLYGSAGESVIVSGLRNGSGGSFVLDASVTGYTVDCAVSTACTLP